jgi:ATP-binding cassette subfamily F protein 3
MTLISAENIVKQFHDNVLFSDLSFSINETDRIGLVGPNGIGKTTLFEIIEGRMPVDSGRIVKSKQSDISYVEQELAGDIDISLIDYVTSARSDLLSLKTKIDEAATKLETDPGSEKKVEMLGQLQNRFELDGGYEYEAEIKIILAGLGFPESRFSDKLSSFSGGERNRAALAKMLAARSNLLLLDEPTNHLDIESTIWLEEYLNGQDKAFIVVSHDRTFLTNTVKKIWEISGLKINQYFNGFENYLVEREERRQLQQHQYRHQQEEIKRIEDFIRRNIVGQKTKQAQSRRKYLDRLKRVDLPDADKKAPTFSMEAGKRSYNLVLEIEDGVFGYGKSAVVGDVALNLYRGDRVGLIGPNGSGKTTILKTILGELNILEGSLKIGNNVEIAYFDQELENIDDHNTILDELWLVDTLAEAGRLRSFLARFGFRDDDVFKKVAILSGGEKTKLALAKLLFLPANFLIFDEPTNHLDIDARLALEEALKSYNGSFLIVSHDRYFLDCVVDRIAAVKNKSLRIYQGNYSYYRGKQELKTAKPVRKTTSHDKLKEYENFKKQSQTKGKLKKELQSTRLKIKDSETALAKIDRDLTYNIPKTDWGRLSEVSDEKKKLEKQLLKLYTHLEDLEKLNAENSDPDRKSG